MKKKKNKMNYDDFYGVCWYNHFWVLFQIWDMMRIENYHTLVDYHLM